MLGIIAASGFLILGSHTLYFGSPSDYQNQIIWRRTSSTRLLGMFCFGMDALMAILYFYSSR
jgi:hypothetical protein